MICIDGVAFKFARFFDFSISHFLIFSFSHFLVPFGAARLGWLRVSKRWEGIGMQVSILGSGY